MVVVGLVVAVRSRLVVTVGKADRLRVGGWVGWGYVRAGVGAHKWSG